MSDASQGPFAIPTTVTNRQLILGEDDQIKPPFGGFIRPSQRLFDAYNNMHFQANISNYLEQHLLHGIINMNGENLLMSAEVVRKQIFITSKINFYHNDDAESILTNLTTSLKALKLDFVDLFIIEWRPTKEDEDEDDHKFSVTEFVSAMEQCRSQGLAKRIALSNFSSKMMETLLKLENPIIHPPPTNINYQDVEWKNKELQGKNISFFISSANSMFSS